MRVPQIEPITNMTRDHKAVLSKLKAGPVFLAQRSTPAAVLLSVGDYERIMARLEKLELLAEAERIARSIDSGETKTTSHAELMRLISEKE